VNVAREIAWPYRWPDLPAALLLACIALLPFARLVEVPLAGLAMGGLFLTWRCGFARLATPGPRIFTWMFLSFCIPMLVASIDAVNPSKSWLTSLGVLRYLLAGFWVLGTYSRHRFPDWFAAGVTAIVSFWLVDLAWQAASGTDLLGMPRAEQRLNGVFGNHHYQLGPMLVLLLPIALAWLYRRQYTHVANFLLLAGFAAVIGIGTRNAWLMASVSVLVYISLAPRSALVAQRARIAGLAVAVSAIGLIVVWQSPYVQQRIAQSARALEANTPAVDEALTLRLPIWQTAWHMALEHPINGVGPRGFRFAYAEFAPPGDPWVANPAWIGAYHPHQLMLEVWSETGVIGLIGLGLLVSLLHRAYVRAPSAQRVAMLPYAIALVTLLFPLNTGYAMYSSFWSTILWWNIMIFLALAGPARSPEPDRTVPPHPQDAS